MHAAMQHHHLLFPKWGVPPSSRHRLRAYLRKAPQRSGSLGQVGSVWLETVERGVLVGNTRIWKDSKTHDDDEIRSCNEEAFDGHLTEMNKGKWENREGG